MRKLMITGAGGFLGRRLMRYYQDRYEILPLPHSRLDFLDAGAVLEYLCGQRPELVIHCAAISDTGRCEEDPEESYRVNVLYTENIARACGSIHAKLLFCSSDQIYAGSPGTRPHREEEGQTPVNVYGKHKLEAEKRCALIAPDSVSLRLSWMYDSEELCESEHGDLLRTVLQALRQGETLRYPTSDYRGITFVWEVVRKMEQAFTLPGGSYNFGSGNNRSTYETVKKMVTAMDCGGMRGGRAEIEPVSGRPYRNLCMDTNKAERYGIRFPDTLEGLVKAVSFRREA